MHEFYNLNAHMESTTKQLKFAKKVRNWSVKDWEDAFSSDESMFQMVDIFPSHFVKSGVCKRKSYIQLTLVNV